MLDFGRNENALASLGKFACTESTPRLIYY